MKPKFLGQGLLVALVLASTTQFTLHGQETASAPQKNSVRPMPALGGQGAFMAGLGPVANVLTGEQRASFRQAMESQREKMRDTEGKLRAARQKVFDGVLDGKFDEGSVREQALAVATLEAELAVIRAKALSQIQPPLSPEQIEKAKAAFAAVTRNAERLQPLAPAERRHNLTSTNRDENDLPRKR